MRFLIGEMPDHGYPFNIPGIFLNLDEPEAALSPNRQLSALAIMHDLVENNSQLIVASHSPILMAYPKSRILHLSKNGIKEIEFEETEHFEINKLFFSDDQNVLHKILEARSHESK